MPQAAVPISRREWYQSYLQTDEWKERARRVRRRANNRCEGCGIMPTDGPLEVHHITYERVGNEFLWDLVAVCGECHDRCHGRASAPRVVALSTAPQRELALHPP